MGRVIAPLASGARAAPGDPVARRSAVWGYALVSSALASASTALRMRDGVPLTFDGWAYWQGSVSLLEGHGYRYFAGSPIRSWPPLFSAYLAAFQAVLGVSGHALVVAMAALAAFAAFGWCALFLAPAGRGLSPRPFAVAGAGLSVAIAGFVANELWTPVANFLVFAIAPVAFHLAARLHRAETARASLTASTALALVNATMLLTHNASIAFLPGSAAIALLGQRALRRERRLVAAAIASVGPLIPWSLVRVALGQWRSHAIGLGAGNYGFIATVRQLVHALATPFSFPHWGHGTAICAVACAAVLMDVRRAGLARELRAPLVVALVYALSLVAIFEVVWILDPIDRRFTGPLAAALISLAILGAAEAPLARGDLHGPTVEPAPPKRRTARDILDFARAALGMLLVTITATHLVAPLLQPAFEPPFSAETWKDDPFYAYGDLTISTTYTSGDPVRRGERWLVAAPSFPWDGQITSAPLD